MNDREKANPVIFEETGGREDYQNEKSAEAKKKTLTCCLPDNAPAR